ncbi:MAG TPA: hypothetical protein VN706_12030 [Gemmatimonadaceae bacterium]|nr:hypothetical protein [Gemmatimonadaceae bacterium]
MKRAFWSVLIALLTGVTARAQVCTGAASFGAGALRAGAGIDRADARNTKTLSFAAGAGPSAFLEGAFSWRDVDDLSAPSTRTVAGSGGYELGVGATGALRVCPMARLAYTFTSQDVVTPGFGNASANASQTMLMIGAGIGQAIHSGGESGFALVPSIAVWVVTAPRQTGDAASDITYGRLDLALGVVFAGRVTIAPHAAYNGARSDLTRYSRYAAGVRVGVNFGDTP